MKGSEHVRMTSEEMREAYPDQALGLQNAIYPEDDDVNFISAEVVYVGETMDQLLERQLTNKEPIFTWYTGDGPAFPFVDICIIC